MFVLSGQRLEVKQSFDLFLLIKQIPQFDSELQVGFSSKQSF